MTAITTLTADLAAATTWDACGDIQDRVVAAQQIAKDAMDWDAFDALAEVYEAAGERQRHIRKHGCPPVPKHHIGRVDRAEMDRLAAMPAGPHGTYGAWDDEDDDDTTPDYLRRRWT